jgi:hypothetical protein
MLSPMRGFSLDALHVKRSYVKLTERTPLASALVTVRTAHCLLIVDHAVKLCLQDTRSPTLRSLPEEACAYLRKRI